MHFYVPGAGYKSYDLQTESAVSVVILHHFFRFASGLRLSYGQAIVESRVHQHWCRPSGIQQRLSK
jgi:hypothetical protein